jgi:hypothetical protein
VSNTATIRRGSRGPAVRNLQRRLLALEYNLGAGGADGVFGERTELAVRAFQTKYSLTPDGVVGPRTWAALLSRPSLASPFIPTASEIEAQARAMGYQTWNTKFRLWLFGIRNKSRDANAFDDFLGAIWVDSYEQKQFRLWQATTDPGTFWLQNPSNPSGTAILVADQYRDVWMIDRHAGKYEALCQRRGKVRVYRDASGDKKLNLDPSTIQEGMFGINIHAATQREGATSVSVDRWSAGCQVHATEAGFREMMYLARQQVLRLGLGTFSYTLLDQWW